MEFKVNVNQLQLMQNISNEIHHECLEWNQRMEIIRRLTFDL